MKSKIIHINPKNPLKPGKRALGVVIDEAVFLKFKEVSVEFGKQQNVLLVEALELLFEKYRTGNVEAHLTQKNSKQKLEP